VGLPQGLELAKVRADTFRLARLLPAIGVGMITTICSS